MTPAPPISPCFVVDLPKLRANAQLLGQVAARSGAKILLAQKAYSCWPTYPLLKPHLHGTCASGPWEAQLGHLHFGGETHVYSPAFTDHDIATLLPFAHHLSFNSPSQWQRHRRAILAAPRPISCGLRINPECSTASTALYDPCAPGSRLGTTAANLAGQDIDGLDGLHFHTLCEQDSDALELTLQAVEEKFAPQLEHASWLNMGGGHHITRPGYDIDRLVRLVQHTAARWDLQIYLEPGEAVALDAGYLVATVIDIIHNAGPIALLDVSATAHMPDVLEMPYRPHIIGAGEPGEHPHSYRLGGGSCLAGDLIGNYSFPAPLQPGQQLTFTDMAHYSMVKTTFFNGVQHPAIATWEGPGSSPHVIRQFTFEDFRARLG
jgi:carboxynorspermidine decarboxylase